MGLLIIFIMIIFLIKNKKSYIYTLLIMLTISIPSNYIVEDTLMVNINHLPETKIIIITFLIILLFVGLITKKDKINIGHSDILFIIFSVLIITFTMLGINNKNIYLQQDIKVYVILIITFFIGKNIVTKKQDINNLFRVILVSSGIYALITILIFLFGKGYLPEIYGEKLYSWWGNRVTFSNTSILIVTTSISFYNMLLRKNIFFNCIIFFLGFWSILISQTRSLIIFALINLLISLLLYLFKKSNNKFILQKNILISFFVLTGILIAFFTFKDASLYTLNNNLFNEIIYRFEAGSASLDVRNRSNEIVIEDILKNPLGYGLGKELILYGDQFTDNSQGVYLDNSFITVLSKMGVLGILIYICILLYLPIRLIFIFHRTRNEYFLLFLLLYPSFIITSAFLTSQIVYSSSVSMFFVTIYILITNYRDERRLAEGTELN